MALQDYGTWLHPLHFPLLVKTPSGMQNINFITALVLCRQQPGWLMCPETGWVPAMGAHGEANPVELSLVLGETLGTRTGRLAGSVLPLTMTPLKFKVEVGGMESNLLFKV